MKQFSFLTLFVVLIAFSFTANAQSYTIDTEASTLHWVGKKVTGQHEGFVKINSGLIAQRDDKYVGSFELDMNSITCTDMEGEYADKLVGHLKSEDFFNAEKHPFANLKILDITEKRGENQTHTIKAALNIKGISNEIEFPATLTFNDDKMTGKAKFSIDRTKWDIKYGSGSFFDSLGDNMIYDDIDFTVTLVSK